jgi:hypothetical protein
VFPGNTQGSIFIYLLLGISCLWDQIAVHDTKGANVQCETQNAGRIRVKLGAQKVRVEIFHIWVMAVVDDP